MYGAPRKRILTAADHPGFLLLGRTRNKEAKTRIPLMQARGPHKGEFGWNCFCPIRAWKSSYRVGHSSSKGSGSYLAIFLNSS